MRMVRMTLGVFIVVAVIATLVILSRLQYVLIQSVHVKGNKSAPTDDVLALVRAASDKNALFVFPKRNRALFPEKEIESKIREQWKQVEEVDVRFVGLTTAEVHIVERDTRYLWCSSGDCFNVDDEGYIFSRVDGDMSAIDALVLSAGRPEDAADDWPLGTHFTDAAGFKRLKAFLETLQNFGIVEPVQVDAEPGEYHIILQNGTKLLVRKDQDFGRIADHLKASLADNTLTTAEGRLKDLLYIDLRFDNKVYYKLR